MTPRGLVLLCPSGHLEDLNEADMQALNNQQDEAPRGAAVRTACLLSWVAGRDDGPNVLRRSNRSNVEEPCSDGNTISG
jgi:hypothetical protein